MPVFIDDKNFVHIKCEECDTEAPPASEIIKGFGLNNMGWYCVGGKFWCPTHAAPSRSIFCSEVSKDRNGKEEQP